VIWQAAPPNDVLTDLLGVCLARGDPYPLDRRNSTSRHMSDKRPLPNMTFGVLLVEDGSLPEDIVPTSSDVGAASDSFVAREGTT